jgi:hypothetical protein
MFSLTKICLYKKQYNVAQALLRTVYIVVIRFPKCYRRDKRGQRPQNAVPPPFDRPTVPGGFSGVMSLSALASVMKCRETRHPFKPDAGALQRSTKVAFHFRISQVSNSRQQMDMLFPSSHPYSVIYTLYQFSSGFACLQ